MIMKSCPLEYNKTHPVGLLPFQAHPAQDGADVLLVVGTNFDSLDFKIRLHMFFFGGP